MTRTGAFGAEVAAFQVILRTWLQLMQSVRDRLVDVPREPLHEAEHRAYVAEAMDHHVSYFLAKSILALRDPAVALCPPRLSLLAKALLWIGGWQPTAALRLVPAGALSAEQASSLEAIRAVTRAAVAAVEKEMRRVQNDGLVRFMLAGRAAASAAAVAAAEKAAIGRMVARQWSVSVVADSLRMEVLRRVVALLSPLQAVDFLADVVRMEISMHQM
ncbi:transcription [Musa troglodytarum]|uniref:Transcription n=1 Tax=Musa troglodytarum TaxID=320322 RepID=A0A9E7GHL4_9LILI|nr:transcription [Musa troglodytarum]